MWLVHGLVNLINVPRTIGTTIPGRNITRASDHAGGTSYVIANAH